MVETKLNIDYALRLIGIGTLMLFICGWSLLDGFKVWPRRNLDMQVLRPQLLATNLTAEAWLQYDENQPSLLEQYFAREELRVPARLTRALADLRLPAHESVSDVARVRQMEEVRRVFSEPLYTGGDLQTQYVQAVVTLLLGCWAFAVVAWRAGKSYRADAQGLSGSGIGPVPLEYAEISALDWSQWDEKGIIKITTRAGRVVRLDGWHYRGMTAIADMLMTARPDLQPQTQG